MAHDCFVYTSGNGDRYNVSQWCMLTRNAEAVEAKRQRKQAVDAELGELHTRCDSPLEEQSCRPDVLQATSEQCS
jgi:hypothetical protein